MKFLKLITTFFIFFGILPFTQTVYSESDDPQNYKVLSSSSSSGRKLSISNVEAYLTEADTLIENGDFEKAKEMYDQARNLAKQLAGFYRDKIF